MAVASCILFCSLVVCKIAVLICPAIYFAIFTYPVPPKLCYDATPQTPPLGARPRPLLASRQVPYHLT